VQADQSIDPIDSPLTNLRHALGKVRLLLVEQIPSKTSPVLPSVDFARSTAGGANYGVRSLHRIHFTSSYRWKGCRSTNPFVSGPLTRFSGRRYSLARKQ